MSLQNLLKIGQLAEHVADKKQIGKMLVAAKRFHSIGLDGDEMLLLDTFRVKRNAIDLRPVADKRRDKLPSGNVPQNCFVAIGGRDAQTIGVKGNVPRPG